MSYSIAKNQSGVPKGKTKYRFALRMGRNNCLHKTMVLYPTHVELVYKKWELEQLLGDSNHNNHKLFDIISKYLTYTASHRSRQYTKAHSNELTLFKNFMHNVPIDEIKRYHLKDFKDWRKKHSLVDYKTEISVRSVNFSISVLSVLFNWAIEREFYTRANPASRLKDPEDNFRHVLLNPDHISEMLNKSRDRNGWLYTAVMLALFSGLRRKEVLELMWGDVDFHHGLINLRASSTKSKRQRSIPMPDLLEKHLAGIAREGDWVLMENGERVLLNKFWYNWERMRDSLSFAMLPNGLTLTFHDLRHVYAQSLRDAGINLGDIQAFLGHSSVELTIRRYAQRGGVDGKAKVNRLAEVYNIQ